MSNERRPTEADIQHYATAKGVEASVVGKMKCNMPWGLVPDLETLTAKVMKNKTSIGRNLEEIAAEIDKVSKKLGHG